MKKLLFILGFSLLFLVSCNDDNEPYSITNNNPNSIQTSNEPSTTTYIPSLTNETSGVSSTTKPSEGNIENGGAYTEETSEGWEYLG